MTILFACQCGCEKISIHCIDSEKQYRLFYLYVYTVKVNKNVLLTQANVNSFAQIAQNMCVCLMLA